MPYRCEAKSVIGFVQQIACCYLRHGYWWYVTGVIPDRKDPESVDRKLIDKYGIDISDWKRARRKQLGQANMNYLRHDRFFVLMATKGRHAFFEDERPVIRDIRRVPLRYAGYSISYRRGGRTRSGEVDHKWHAHVEIDKPRYKELKAWFLDRAVQRSSEKLSREFWRIPYEPYAPIRRQRLNILRAVNRRRKSAGFEQIPTSVLRTKRQIVKPFDARTKARRVRSSIELSKKR